MKINYQRRTEGIRASMRRDGVDALIVTKGTDIRYLNGFTGEAGVAVVVLTMDKQYFVTDGRFVTQAGQETEDTEVVEWKSGVGLYRTTGNLVQELGSRNPVMDYGDISHEAFGVLAQAMGKEPGQAGPYITEMRMVKDEEEIHLIREACKITEQSFLALLDLIKPGQTEKEIRNLLEFEFRKRGSEDVSFATIVASGAVNGANPHASLTDRKIERGDLITLDFGAKYQGYCSDITRTIAVGKPEQKLVDIYNVVLEAKQAAEATLREKVATCEVDGAARSVIEKAGHVLPHGPGHGFGLDIHEDPFLGPRNQYQMQAGVVHTIEPGVYVPGVGGVRIEDDYLILRDGAECLTPNITRELIVL